MRQQLRKIGVACTLAVAAGALCASATAAVPQAPKAHEVSPTPVAAKESSAVIFYDGFDGPLNQSLWQRADIAPDGEKSQAQFLPENAYTEGGLLHLLSRRHCVPVGGTPNHLNVSVGTCTGNKVMRYSAGRVNGAFQTPAGINWEIRVAALLPGNGVPGTRVAFWGRNNQPYCKDSNTKTLLGEVDILEWHPEKENQGDSTTHMSCSASLAEPEPKRWATKQAKSVPQFDDNQWYEWIAQKIDNQVVYYLGSSATGYWHIGTHTCGEGSPPLDFSGGTCAAILNDPFHAILQTDVFGPAGWAGHPAPSQFANFPDQHALIDWISITQL